MADTPRSLPPDTRPDRRAAGPASAQHAADERFLASYRLTHMAVIALVAYAAALPLLGPLLTATVPWAVPVCGFKTLSGQPCPVCGLTTGLAALMRGNLSGALNSNPLTAVAAVLALGEISCRSLALGLRLPPHRMRAVARIDAGLHKLLLGAYGAYSIAFFLREALVR